MGAALLVLLFILLPLAGGLGLAIYVMRGRDVLTRVLIVLAALTVGAVAFVISFAVVSGPVLDWNGAKLAPIVAMTKGYPLYGDRETGVMSAWIYGPVPALLYLPAALFSHPTGAILTGVIITILCGLPPALLIVLWFARRTDWDTWIIAGLMALAFTWVSLTHESMRRAVYMVGPDAPALGLLALSCFFVMGRRMWVTIVLSVACAVLACWCKQTLVPFLVVPPLYIFMVDGFRNAMRYVALLAPIGLMFSAVLVISFNPSNMWFNMVEISAKHHFQENMYGNVVALWYGVGEWLADAIKPLVLLSILFLLMTLVRSSTPQRLHPVELAARYPWTILLLTAVVLFPSSILGYVKIGGYYNNFALTNYFLLLAAMAGLVQFWPVLREAAPQLASLTRAAACVFVSSKAMTTAVTTGSLLMMGQRILNPRDNVQEQIYEIAKSRPGEIYFPWNTLATLLAEGKLYHFEWGIVDRLEANMPPTPEQMARHMPANTRVIAFPPLFQSSHTLRALPTFNVQAQVKELPGFIVFLDPQRFGIRPPETAAPSPERPPPSSPASDFDLTPRIRR